MKVKYEYLAGFGELGKRMVKGHTEKGALQFVRESWNGYESFAVRVFDPDGAPLKGITLNTDQAIALRDILNTVDFTRYATTS